MDYKYFYVFINFQTKNTTNIIKLWKINSILNFNLFVVDEAYSKNYKVNFIESIALLFSVEE